MKSAGVVTTLIILVFAFGCHAPVAEQSAQNEIGSDVPKTVKPFRNNSPDFQFAIVSDRTGGHRPGVFSHAIDELNMLQPEFVISIGDLIEGYKSDRAELTREYDQLDRIIGRLNMPFFYVAGNHDMGNKVMLDLWRQRRGRTYYNFTYDNVLFIALDTEDPPISLNPELQAKVDRLNRMLKEDPGKAHQWLKERMKDSDLENEFNTVDEVHISDRQVAYVRRALQDYSDVRWTVLLMHKPAWRDGTSGFRKIEKMLADRPYTVFAGHTHYYSYQRRLGHDYITLGTTGGVWHGSGPGLVDHISWVTMTSEGPVIANIRLDGIFGKHGPGVELE